jgi:hypothetical protein
MLANHVKINFAHRTFRWTNEARGGHAAVFCVIIGFAVDDSPTKKLFDYQTPNSTPMERIVNNISPYLVDMENIIIQSRPAPICNVPRMIAGNKPNDGGHLILTDEEKNELLRKEPRAEQFIRRFVGSNEFINGKFRWCLWLVGASPTELRTMPEIIKRIERVRESRSAGRSAEATRLAQTPTLFRDTKEFDNYLVIPLISSESRYYIPIGFLQRGVILSNRASFIPNASTYLFGVLSSLMHMAWTRQVCGRLEGRYNYSNNIVYNNFPFPDNPTAAQRERVEAAANRVLESRRAFPNSTLADLYDPNTMPPELVRAHRDLDREVDLCYRRAAFNTELERLQFLFARYRELVAPLAAIATVPRRRRTTR